MIQEIREYRQASVLVAVSVTSGIQNILPCLSVPRLFVSMCIFSFALCFLSGPWKY